jgi:hypothetical protein
MKTATQEYRGYEIVRVAKRRATNVGDTYVVLTKRGENWSSHSSLHDAKGEIDRLLTAGARTDISHYGFTFF